MTDLTLTLIDEIEVDARIGLTDKELLEKHQIAESTWNRWKRQSEEDKLNDMQSAYTLLRDVIKDARGGLTKQIENTVAKMALGAGKHVVTTNVKNKSGEITRSIEQISDRNPSLAASLAWLSRKDPDNWGDKKKVEITSIATIIPDSGRLTEDEWLAKYGNKANKLTQKKPIDTTSVEVKPDETK